MLFYSEIYSNSSSTERFLVLKHAQGFVQILLNISACCICSSRIFFLFLLLVSLTNCEKMQWIQWAELMYDFLSKILVFIFNLLSVDWRSQTEQSADWALLIISGYFLKPKLPFFFFLLLLHLSRGDRVTESTCDSLLTVKVNFLNRMIKDL